MLNTELVNAANRKGAKGAPPEQASPIPARTLHDGGPRKPARSIPSTSAQKLPARAAPGRSMRLQISDTLRAEAALEHAVATLLPPGKALELKFTNNRYSMVTVRRLDRSYAVRAHRMFKDARPRVVRALARYIVHNDPRASRALGDFIRANEDAIHKQPRKRRRLQLRPEGQHHHLQRIFDRLNIQYFEGTLQAEITWGSGPRRPSPRQKSIKMGSFSIEDRIIRIHPLLDNRVVPEYFLAWIVFHEMLHGKHGVVRVGARRCYHTRAFVDEERSFEHYPRACAWEQSNIDRLLRSAAKRGF